MKLDRELGRPWGLVNNAGIITAYGLVEDLSAADLIRNFEVNVIGYILCAREALKRMCRKHGGDGGSIVNISWRAATMGMPKEYVHYAAAKGAVASFTIGLSREVIDQRVRVNSVSPGLIDTEIQIPDRFARLAPTIPIGRAGTPEQVAEAALWLLSDKTASYVTGGGRWLLREHRASPYAWRSRRGACRRPGLPPGYASNPAISIRTCATG